MGGGSNSGLEDLGGGGMEVAAAVGPIVIGRFL